MSVAFKSFTPFIVYCVSIYFQLSAFVFFHVFNILNIQGFLATFVVVLITFFSSFFTYMGLSLSVEGNTLTFQAIRKELNKK